MKDVDFIFPTKNRLFYNQMTFPRIVAECRNSQRLKKLFIYDDMSVDGTWEFLSSFDLDSYFDNKVEYELNHYAIGNSVDQTNNTLKNGTSKYLLKIDNDTLIPFGTIDLMAKVMDENPDIGYLGAGVRPRSRFPAIIEEEIATRDCSHIGGVGIFRREAFNGQFIQSSRTYFGFGQMQAYSKSLGWKTCWLEGLIIMDLDHSETWSMTKLHAELGMGRNTVHNKGVINNLFNAHVKRKKK